MEFKQLYQHDTNVYSMEGFEPAIVDGEYLKNLGVTVEPSQSTLEGLIRGSEVFMKRLENNTVIPKSNARLEELDPETVETEIHNYTGRCPTLTFEINPVKGCHVGCQYCLVTDGVHEQELVAYSNYHLYVRKLLEEMNGTPQAEVTKEDIAKKNQLLQDLAKAIEHEPEKKKEIENQIVEISKGKNWKHYYYFSPKTEALQEPTLATGIAHRILKEFIAHFEKYPDSNARLFIASKAGAKHLLYEYEGETILDLFVKLKDKMQFNTSVSIMPTEFRNILEPYAAPIEERLKSVKLCQENGILANSALIQPIFTPYLTDEHIKEFFDMLHGVGIINYKPEFLTACMENLAMLGQWLGYYDKSLEKALYEDYIMPTNADHKKQRGRTAPNRALSIENICKMMNYTKTLGMTTSICYWVRKQLNIEDALIPIINENGFQCLGYQSQLFNNK
ncbi:MAG: hypothetical protein PHC41_01330 [Lachnospiraceae bacterium]|nr:hypothetical protein [Lachnospiraceae bacterium]MDD3614849.1 hypothetical protein [Lachnospiraceae bacterium]